MSNGNGMNTAQPSDAWAGLDKQAVYELGKRIGELQEQYRWMQRESHDTAPAPASEWVQAPLPPPVRLGPGGDYTRDVTLESLRDSATRRRDGRAFWRGWLVGALMGVTGLAGGVLIGWWLMGGGT